MITAIHDVRRLRIVLAAILLALLIPTGLLVAQGLQQLERESYFRLRSDAEELVARTNNQLARWLDEEELRSFADYDFLVVSGDNFVQPSPLARFPVSGGVAGIVSYFQLDAAGALTTPLVPSADVDPYSYGISDPELDERRVLQDRVRDLLSQPQRETGRKVDLDGEFGALAEAVGAVAAEQPDLAQFEGAGYRAPAPSEAKNEEVKDTQEASKESASFAGQRTLDRLDESAQSKLTTSLGRVEDLLLKEPFDVKSEVAEPRNQTLALEDEADDTAAASEPVLKTARARQKRTEQNLAPVQAPLPAAEPARLARDVASSAAKPSVRVEQFTSEVEPFRFTLLDDAHFALYRTAWRDGSRFIQGSIIERAAVVRSGVAEAFLGSRLASTADLRVAFQGELLWSHSARGVESKARGAEPRARGVNSEARGAGPTTGSTPILLYRDRLEAPFADVELILSAADIPVDAGGAVVTWAGVALVTFLVGGFALVYRLGLQQIQLSHQQQDFVSAVSHELKTPLTSIRMYGEILQAGWASEEKKRSYYDFIAQESERLSRLISNVLQLARLTRNDNPLNLEPLSVDELMDLARSKISTQMEQANFALVENHDAHGARLLVDTDAFAQVMINLVDNAIKFSAEAETKRIDLTTRKRQDSVEILLRDYGPGIPKDQLKKIFQLFYRTERELTRETVGTGIGLALVNELVTSMRGSIDVRNVQPGVEFCLRFTALRD